MAEKIYTGKNVYEAFQERMDFIFAEFDNISVSFSGGKDSGVLWSLVMQYMEDRNIRRPIGLFHQDFEAQYTLATEYIDRVFQTAPDFVQPYRFCLPMSVPNSLSAADHTWIAWDDQKPELWVRPMPTHKGVINLDNNCFDFYQYRMWEWNVYKNFDRWYHRHSGGGKTVALLGIRATESLQRYSAVINGSDYKGRKWFTAKGKGLYSAAPLYDWTTEDVWTANGKFGFDYNHLYDEFYKLGLPLRAMRFTSPFHVRGQKSLELYKQIDPAVWDKLLKRTSGVNFGATYAQTDAMVYRNEIKLPPEHTWQSYCQFLLSTLPPPERERYEKRFKIADSDSEQLWKKRCYALLRNDRWGFASSTAKATEKELEHTKKLKSKYAALVRGRR